MTVKVSVVMPVYNSEPYINQAVESVLSQTFTEFELLIIDDCTPDESIERCRQYQDARIRLIQHEKNRGLAGARNTGIRHARADYIAFLDSDDAWHEEKLARHVAHLDQCPEVGISFSRSMFMTPDGQLAHYYQMPKLQDIDVGHCWCRNPVGNGSAPVLRRSALEAVRYQDDRYGTLEDRYFDEDLRQSEDIECWVRILIKSGCQIEGLPDALTYYRLNAGGLSAQIHRQYASWEAVLEKLRELDTAFVRAWERPARAYQMRYLARQAVRLQDGHTAVYFVHRALAAYWPMLWAEPGRTLCTLAAAYLLRVLPKPSYVTLEKWAQVVIGKLQRKQIATDFSSSSH